MATTSVSNAPMTAEEKKVIFASSLGTVFEWYDFYLGGFKSEVQHLQACKVRRCKTRPDSISNFSLKNA
jgi:hypothetical protein